MDTLENNREKWRKLRDNGLDLAIMGKGSVSLYYKEAVLNYDLALLKEKKYELIEFDCAFLASTDELHFELERKLDFPVYYGRNFDALNDCLHDYVVNANGVVLVFRNLNHLENRTIHILLDIFAQHARRQLVMGKRLLILGQVDNPKFSIKEPIGSVNFYLWNDNEWFEGDRVHNR